VQDAIALEPQAGELLLDGQRIAFTPLEFAVMSHLHAKRGKVVSRITVLRDVWETTMRAAATSLTPSSDRSARN
jgi:DNA-binding winged helix-turn-helix (wHTH) protein